MPFPRIYAINPALAQGGAWITGTGAPAAALGDVGNFYLDTANGKAYEKTAAAVWTERGSITNNWRTGVGAPAGALGFIGDWYYDTATQATYAKTAAAVWTAYGFIGTSASGTWSSGSGAPAGAFGSIGNYYLDTDNGKSYEKTGALAWTERGSLTNNWRSGAGAPAGALGFVGDWYYDTADSQMYQKTAALVWTSRGFISSAAGGFTMDSVDPTMTEGLLSDGWDNTTTNTVLQKQNVIGLSDIPTASSAEGTPVFLERPQLVSFGTAVYYTNPNDLFKVADPVETTAEVAVYVNGSAPGTYAIEALAVLGARMYVAAFNVATSNTELWSYTGSVWTLIATLTAPERVWLLVTVGAETLVISKDAGSTKISSLAGDVYTPAFYVWAGLISFMSSAVDGLTAYIGGRYDTGGPRIWSYTGGVVAAVTPGVGLPTGPTDEFTFLGMTTGFLVAVCSNAATGKPSLFQYVLGVWTDKTASATWFNTRIQCGISTGGLLYMGASIPADAGDSSLYSWSTSAMAAVPHGLSKRNINAFVLHSDGKIYAQSNVYTVSSGLLELTYPSWVPTGGSKAASDTTGHEAWIDTGDYWATTENATNKVFQVLRGGYGLIKGVRKYYSGKSPAVTYPISANGSYYCGITATGQRYLVDTSTLLDSNKLTQYNNFESAYDNNMILFEVWYFDRVFTVVKENHETGFPTEVCIQQHFRFGNVYLSSGAAISVLTSADRSIQLIGGDVMDDHGLLTNIPDGTGAAMVLNHAYKPAVGALIPIYLSTFAAGVTVPPAVGDTYTNAAGSTFTVLRTTIVAGAGTIKWWRSTTAATGSLVPVGVMTAATGGGTSPITAAAAPVMSNVPAIYINAGAVTPLGTSGANRFGLYAIYGSKDSLNTATPSYWCIPSTAAYPSFNLATASIGTSAVPSLAQFSIPDELVGLEIAILGFVCIDGQTAIIPTSSNNGFVNGVRSFKATTSSVFSGGNVSVVAAANVTQDTTQFAAGSRLARVPENTSQKVSNNLTRLSFDTAANLAALAAGTVNAGDVAYVEATNTWYQYSTAMASTFLDTVDNLGIINGPAGSGRWFGVAGANRYWSMKVAILSNTAGQAFVNLALYTGRSWRIYGIAIIDATADLYEAFEMVVIKKTSDYTISILTSGDDSGLDFVVSAAGAVTFTSATYAGLSASTSGIFFRIETLPAAPSP